MKFTSLKIIPACLLIGTLGCQKKSENTSTGNPLVSLTVTASGQNSSVRFRPKSIFEKFFFPRALALPPPALFDSGLRSVSLNEFWIVLKDIELKGTETDSATETPEVQSVGPFAINLLSSSPSPLTELYAPATGLRRIRTKLEKIATPPTGAPAELGSHSVAIKGTVSGFLLSVLLADGLDYEVSGPNAVQLQTGSRLLLSIQTADLFKKIDLGAISADTVIDAGNRVSATNPCPLIDASATDLYTCFRIGLKNAANVGEDTNGDADLSDTEEQVK